MWSLPDERIELLGASGRAYSFHLADPALAEGRAGQYAICAEDGSVAVLAETEDLACGAQMLQSVRSSSPNARLYLRLNVRRRTRMEELQDLISGDALLAALIWRARIKQVWPAPDHRRLGVEGAGRFDPLASRRS